MIEFETAGSHLYPGATLHCREWSVPGATAQPARLHFADLSNVMATVILQGDALLLSVDAYETGAGTAIGPKVWRLQPSDSPASFRVTSRAAAPLST